VPKNQEKHGKNPARESIDEYHVLNTESISPELLEATIHELSTKSSRNTTIFTTTIIMATISTIFPPVAGNPINPATTTNLGNLTTTNRQFVKTTIKFRTLELESIAILQDNHANFRRVGHGIRN
jgi:spore maturation protein SpmA